MRSKVPHDKKQKRIGRGHGSGHGKTSTRGHKGQGSRSGFHMRAGFEGGQTPLYQKVAKRGFNNKRNHKLYAILNLDRLDTFDTSEISPKWLLEQRILKKLGSGLKILGRGKVKKKVTVHAHRFSQQAKQAIEKAGGQAILIEGN